MKIIEQYDKSDILPGPINITDANYIGDFAIRIFFSNGYSQLVDFKPFLKQAKHPTIKKYLNEDRFKKFEIKSGNLDWNDFEMCFPLIDLYKNTILKREKHISP